MSHSVNGDVERITLAPGVERVNTTVRIVETDKKHFGRVVISSGLWSLLLVVTPVVLLIVSIVRDSHDGIQLASVWLAFGLSFWAIGAYLFFKDKEYLKKEEVARYNTISFPTDYFVSLTRQTVDGARTDVVFSELGEARVPESIRELVSACNVTDKVASFVKRGEGRIVFTYDEWAGLIELNTSRIFALDNMTPLLECDGNSIEDDLYVATINGEVLPRENGYYFLPDDLLTTSELLRRAK